MGQKEVRNYTTEHFRIKACYEENLAAYDAVKRENKNLGDEVKDLLDQIGEGGRNYHEVQKTYKRLELEREELKAAPEEVEASYEQENNKWLRGQLELGQIKQEVERRLADKDEEHANTKKTQTRALESLQASLWAESRAKQDVYKDKKKLESDINELEISYDHANKANADLQKHIKKLHADYKEVHDKWFDQQKVISDYKEQYGIAERRGNALYGELEESKTLLEQSEKLFSDNGLLTVAKRKLEGDLHTLHADLDELLAENKHSDEKMKKAQMDAAKLADELRAEHEHYSAFQKQYKNLEVSYKELHMRYEESHANAAKSGKQALAKLEGRVKELEAALSDETNRYADCMKNFRKCERRIKELSFQGEEDKKNYDRMQDLVDKLQVKIKTYKKQIEEAEEIAALNLAKFRKVQQTLETHESSSVTIIKRTIIN